MTQPEYVFDHLFRNRLEMIRSQVGTELSTREHRDRHGSRIQADIIHGKAANYACRTSHLHRVRLGGEGLRITQRECRAEISVARCHKSLQHPIASAYGTSLRASDHYPARRTSREAPRSCFRWLSLSTLSTISVSESAATDSHFETV